MSNLGLSLTQGLQGVVQPKAPRVRAETASKARLKGFTGAAGCGIESSPQGEKRPEIQPPTVLGLSASPLNICQPETNPLPTPPPHSPPTVEGEESKAASCD